MGQEYYRALEPHDEPPKEHHPPPEPHHEPPKEHHAPPEPHYEPPKEHYVPPEPHHEPPKEHYEPPKEHYAVHEPHYEPPKEHYVVHEPHYEPPKEHYGAHEPHYEPPKEHYGAPEPHYEPPKEHYGAPEPHHEPHDPHHDDKKCVDISTWGHLEYKKVEKEHCKVEYQKYTEKKKDKVCSEVTSIHCTVLPYTECEMKLKTEKYYSCEWFWNYKPIRKCHNVVKTVTHYKKKPECKTVPKYHCEEKWDKDEYGKKVWAGNGDCKLIEWEDCKLISVPAKFQYLQPDCSHKVSVPVHDVKDKPDSTETSSMTCKVKKATNCDAKVAKKCKHIHYTETVIKPVSKCVPFYVYVPFQERHHKKKCVFGDHKDGHDLGHYSGGKHH